MRLRRFVMCGYKNAKNRLYKTVDLLTVLLYNISVYECDLKRNISRVLERVDKATPAGGRVTVIAATKTVPSDIVLMLHGSGICDIGENRVQEYLSKRDAFSGFTRHFIGTLQRNKAKYLVGDVALIQSVSNAALMDTIDSLAAKRALVQDVLVEVNIGGEQSKTGACEADAERLIEHARGLCHVRLRGLMAVPPRNADERMYERLYAIYRKYEGGSFDTLSVGMSGDFERAIAHGGNMVRIGAALFGKRA